MVKKLCVFFMPHSVVVVAEYLYRHHHYGRASGWSVAVSMSCFHCPGLLQIFMPNSNCS